LPMEKTRKHMDGMAPLPFRRGGQASLILI
jgi:hypothetical protein